MKQMDGAQTFTDECKIGSHVMREMAATRLSRRPETPERGACWPFLIGLLLSKPARAEVGRKCRATSDHPWLCQLMFTHISNLHSGRCFDDFDLMHNDIGDTAQTNTKVPMIAMRSALTMVI